ncbi:hypothetical protein G169_gp54 [Pseudomonas phage AF]|uniref:hypothetical protein n=1 Tax=Pseudomonas phage AF TaxID=1235689 RepID=UPI000297057C|nr:hypothetical protein G169_gp54 [Pseudomonas phage AF]AFV50667.1 hypothetical protein AF_054 [Pseudomonas phage AF]
MSKKLLLIVAILGAAYLIQPNQKPECQDSEIWKWNKEQQMFAPSTECKGK